MIFAHSGAMKPLIVYTCYKPTELTRQLTLQWLISGDEPPFNLLAMLSRFLLVAGLWLALLACQPQQLDVVQPASEPLDSLVVLPLLGKSPGGQTTLTLKLPRFEALVKLSQTPAGQLDKTVNSLTNPTTGVQYLYTQQGQPAGWATFPQGKTLGGTTLYYQYQDGRLNRVFTKAYEFEMAKDFIYFMDEFHYTDGRASSKDNYFLDLRKGQAQYTSTTDFTYDEEGNLLTTRDRRGYSYPVYTWQKGNIVKSQYYSGDNKPFDYSYYYAHDSKPNPLKAFELPHEPVSANNEVSEIVVQQWYSPPSSTAHELIYSTTYELTYKGQGLLASSLKVMANQSFPTEYYLYK